MRWPAVTLVFNYLCTVDSWARLSGVSQHASTCVRARAQVSVVDQAPQELLAAALLGIHVRYAAGLGPGGATDSLRLSVDAVQLDDELPGTRYSCCLIPTASPRLYSLTA